MPYHRNLSTAFGGLRHPRPSRPTLVLYHRVPSGLLVRVSNHAETLQRAHDKRGFDDLGRIIVFDAESAKILFRNDGK